MTAALGWKVTPLLYASDVDHYLLSPEATRPGGGNIGRNGEHLTIVVLTMNRPNLVERLLISLAEHAPAFAGDVLIVDNGSGADALRRLRLVVQGAGVKTRLVELAKNRGVAAGRNEASRHVKTSWMLFLDDDMYFVSNPFAAIQKDLAQLGCKFSNVRILNSDRTTTFAQGGHLSITTLPAEGRVKLGHGSSRKSAVASEIDPAPELGTFLFGTALIEVSAFHSIGGFDEELFVGFEDTDLSIRLFQAGMKVGAAGPFAFVHDHPEAATSGEDDYDKARYSREAIRASALHMERKHGFSFWDEYLSWWLDTKHASSPRTAAPGRPAPMIASPSVHTKKLRLAIVIDRDGWAFANIAKQMWRHLNDVYDISLVDAHMLSGNVTLLLALEGFDAVHFLWRRNLIGLTGQYTKSQVHRLGFRFDEFWARQFKDTSLTTGVYDHLFLSPEEIEAHKPCFDLVHAYSVCSERLKRVYNDIDSYPKPDAVLTDGVDLDLFGPSNLHRLTETRPLVIGWAGNSKWGPADRDRKGFHTVLRPALDELRRQGIPVDENFADLQIRRRELWEMPAYYSGVDVLVCVSEAEGTPNPVLEAMACGIPVVSADVGVVPEAFGARQFEFILQQTTQEALVEALKRLHFDRPLLAELSRENLEAVRPWAWRDRASAFKPFFDLALERRGSKMPAADVAM